MSFRSPPSHDEKLGIIGLGLLGAALAERALEGGLTVWGYDLDEARRMAFVAAGGEAAGSSTEIARTCQPLLLVLPHDGVTRQVVEEMGSALETGTVILDATTGDPEAAVRLALALAERGIGYLDATISGSSVQARAGEALWMVGGARDAFNACANLFKVLTDRVMHVGPSGAGAKMKLVTNLVLGLNRAALAEGLVLAAKLGLHREQALEVLQASMAYSRIMETKGGKMIRGDFAPQARLSQHLKDVDLMLEAAERAGQRLPLTEAHRELLARAEGLGLGALDNSAVLRAIESLGRAPAES